MDKAERLALIEEYGQGYAKLVTCLEEIPQKMWQYKPAPIEWSVHEIIIHLADSETNSYLRARRLVAEPGQPLMAYDQDVWANKLDYHAQSWQDGLAVLEGVRKMTYDFIRMLPDEVWENTVVHAENDRPYSFTMWLEIYAAHIPLHIQQIQDNHAHWLANQD
ncbi:MAG: DinB family protein [Anaerolineales bacterium]|nr:DinB family protein [Anaerolineales bacterium]